MNVWGGRSNIKCQAFERTLTGMALEWLVTQIWLKRPNFVLAKTTYVPNESEAMAQREHEATQRPKREPDETLNDKADRSTPGPATHLHGTTRLSQASCTCVLTRMPRRLAARPSRPCVPFCAPDGRPWQGSPRSCGSRSAGQSCIRVLENHCKHNLNIYVIFLKKKTISIVYEG